MQYAALSAVFALSRDVAGAISGWATTHLGYAPYFVLTFFLAFPALALLPIVRTWIHDRDPAAAPAASTVGPACRPDPRGRIGAPWTARGPGHGMPCPYANCATKRRSIQSFSRQAQRPRAAKRP